MSRVKTYKVTEDQFEDLMKALNLTRSEIPRVCKGVTASAFGWWKHQGQIPFIHLASFKNELQRQLKLRPKSDLDRKVEGFLSTAFALMDATGSATPIPKNSAFYEKSGISNKPPSMRELLRHASQEELINEILRRGGTVTFGPKKSKPSLNRKSKI